ncbi:MAG: protein kinase family protein [Chlamydiales bacterium]|nr:protein kinase family protein [Chlamydiales bacterium]
MSLNVFSTENPFYSLANLSKEENFHYLFCYKLRNEVSEKLGSLGVRKKIILELLNFDLNGRLIVHLNDLIPLIKNRKITFIWLRDFLKNDNYLDELILKIQTKLIILHNPSQCLIDGSVHAEWKKWICLHTTYESIKANTVRNIAGGRILSVGRSRLTFKLSELKELFTVAITRDQPTVTKPATLPFFGHHATITVEERKRGPIYDMFYWSGLLEPFNSPACLGFGSFGIVQEIYYPASSSTKVMKSARVDRQDRSSLNFLSSSLLNEYFILKDIHRSKVVPGIIAEPEKVYQFGEALFGITNRAYRGDLRGFFERYSAKHSEIARWNILKATIQVAEGLEYMSKNDILHLDIKPPNILYDITDRKKLRFYLADFGLASTVADRIDEEKIIAYTRGYALGEDVKIFECLLLDQNDPSCVEEADAPFRDLFEAQEVYAFGVTLREIFSEIFSYKKEDAEFLNVGYSMKLDAEALFEEKAAVIAEQYDQIENRYGDHMSQLIKEMTDIDYTKRPSLSAVRQRLQFILREQPS